MRNALMIAALTVLVLAVISAKPKENMASFHCVVVPVVHDSKDFPWELLVLDRPSYVREPYRIMFAGFEVPDTQWGVWHDSRKSEMGVSKRFTITRGLLPYFIRTWWAIEYPCKP